MCPWNFDLALRLRANRDAVFFDAAEVDAALVITGGDVLTRRLGGFSSGDRQRGGLWNGNTNHAANS